MSRSGYSDDCEYLELYRNAVDRAIKGKRGQAFLKEMAAALDAMPVKRLIAAELIAEDGEVCAIGSVCKARGVDVSKIDPFDPDGVADMVGIARALAAEIEYINDDGEELYGKIGETPEQRWVRVRLWVDEQVKGVSRG